MKGLDCSEKSIVRREKYLRLFESSTNKKQNKLSERMFRDPPVGACRYERERISVPGKIHSRLKK